MSSKTFVAGLFLRDSKTFFRGDWLWNYETISMAGNKLAGDLGEVVSLQEQTSPYFQLREKPKCIDCIGKSKFWSKTSP